MILSRDIDDQKILQSDWIRGTTGHTRSKVVVLDNTFLQGSLLCKISKRLIDSFQKNWWSKNTAIWLLENILGHNWRNKFTVLRRIIENIVIYIFRAKKDTSMDNFFGKSQKTLTGLFGLFSQFENFSEKLDPVSFWQLKELRNYNRKNFCVYHKNRQKQNQLLFFKINMHLETSNNYLQIDD